LIWVLGHPKTWLTLFLWITLLTAIVKIAKRLWTHGKWFWLMLFFVIVSAALTYYIWLSQNAFDLYVQGRGHEFIALRYAKRGVLILSILSLIWIIADWLKSKQSS
jgi:hypothetical protein